jgi:NADH-quinone oxidoreductase subunit F
VKDQQDNNCNCGSQEKENIPLIVDDILKHTGKESDKVIAVLQEVQNRFNYLPSDALKYICSVSDITPGQLSGVATFYSQFRHLPAGKNIIKICTGTACHVKGSLLIIESFRRALKINDDSVTSPDSLFSIEEVACLGCCTLAPVVQINEKTYGHVKPTQAEEIINDFLKSGNNNISLANFGEKDTAEAEIRVGLGSCCIAGGSREILSEITKIKQKYDLHVHIKPVGCVGVCNQTPLLEIVTNDNSRTRYANVKRDQVEDIILEQLKPRSLNKWIRHQVADWIDTFISDEKIKSPVNLPDTVREKYLNNFLNDQVHIATNYSGTLAPDSLTDYTIHDGFRALHHCLKNPDRMQLIDLITDSGLRGRGGGGFITGHKWKISYNAEKKEKYVVCNGDEGDPGAFMDRMLLESFPYRVIEGVIIAGYSIGAKEGIFYIRAEYPLAVSRVRNAINDCYKHGLLGSSVAGTDFSFDIRIFEGAGAFVCGEETALIESLEGKRGMPHLRPPYPAVEGYRGCPTLVNNVETFSLVPWIILNGAESFRCIGTDHSKGTKVFALAGKVSRGGLIEVPMGITIRTIVEKIGNGVGSGRKFKAVQIGGPSGGCIPERLSDTPIDFEELNKLGAMMGSGGMVVLDDTDCIVDMAKYFLLFTHKQSCGKCTFCRVGTKKMLNILIKLTEGKATSEDINELEKLCYSVKKGSLCGLGITAPNPVISGLRYFREEYEAHAKGICPAGKCRSLIRYRIKENCTGCTKCAQECPVNAIPFRPYEQHLIDDALCTKCDNCRVVCPEDAIEIISANG